MASMSSVISLAVLLLATYCYSVPLVTDYDYTTAGYGLTHGTRMVSGTSMPSTFPEEYTTGYSMTNPKRDYSNKKESSESGEMTTEHSMAKDGYPKRGLDYGVTSSPFETATMMSGRSLDMEYNGEYTTERSYAERDIDSYTTMESNTEYNSPSGQMGERGAVDMDMTTDFESTSSGASFGHNTGLFHTRKVEESATVGQPNVYYRKTETIVPGKITKTELSSDGKHRSYSYKEMPVDHQEPSFSEGTTEESHSKTNTDH